MKKTVLFGAGQVGAMVSRLLGQDYRVVCFADNSEVKWGQKLAGLPILSPEESLTHRPDCVCLCVLDPERAAQMESQLRSLGYDGPLLSPGALRIFDARAATMRMLAEQIAELGIQGCAAELGVYRGEFAALINAALPDRPLHLFDTFEGFQERDLARERNLEVSGARAGDFSGTSEIEVRRNLPFPQNAVFHPGWFPDTFHGCEELRFAFVSIDADLYDPTAAALPLFWERLCPGGALLIHDVYSGQFKGAGLALREFCASRSILATPICDLHGSALLRKPLPEL